MSIDFEEKVKDTEALLLNVRQQIQNREEELKRLRDGEQQLLGRLQTISELREESASLNGDLSEES